MKINLTEAFDSTPYDTQMVKRAGGYHYIFEDEEGKGWRVSFNPPSKFGKKVRIVTIGKRIGKGKSYDERNLKRFKKPQKIIATFLAAYRQFIKSPVGKGTLGYAVKFPKGVFGRAERILKKIINRKFRQFLTIVDTDYTPQEKYSFIWIVKKGQNPEKVFSGPALASEVFGVSDEPESVDDDMNVDDAGVSVIALSGFRGTNGERYIVIADDTITDSINAINIETGEVETTDVNRTINLTQEDYISALDEIESEYGDTAIKDIADDSGYGYDKASKFMSELLNKAGYEDEDIVDEPEDDADVPEPVDEPEPETEPEIDVVDIINQLNDLLSGEYDDDPEQFEDAFETALDAIEQSGLIDEYNDLLMRVSDYYTQLLRALV